MTLLYGMMVVVALVATVLPLVALAVRRISWRADVFFLVFYVQVVAYIFGAPTAYAIGALREQPELAQLYLLMQLMVLFLFCIPMLTVYLLLRRPEVMERPVVTAKPPAWRFYLFLIFCVGYTVADVVVLTKTGLLFRRIGTETLAAALGALPSYVFLLVRIYDRMQLPMLALMMVVALQTTNRMRRRMAYGALAICLALVLGVAALNSRSLIVLTLGELVCFFITFKKDVHISPRLVGRMVVIGLLALYLINVAMTVREAGFAAENVLVYFKPSLKISLAAENDSSIAERLNGVDLIAQITPAAWKDNYAKGKAWVPGVVASLGPLVSPELARRYKEELATNAKVYLLRWYAHRDEADYFSCAITDVYGNLGPPGVLFAGVFYGFVFAYAVRWVAQPKRGWHLVLAIFAIQIYIFFEADFIAGFVGWLSFLPSIVPLLVLSPLTIVRRPRASVGRVIGTQRLRAA